MKLECKCNNYQLAVQVRTNGGILSLDFYCANCYTLSSNVPQTPTCAPKIADLPNGLEPTVIPRGTVAETISKAIAPKPEEPTGITREGWTLFGSKNKGVEPKDRDYSVVLNNICGYFNFNPARLAKILECSGHSVYCWIRHVNTPLPKFRTRIDEVANIVGILAEKYGTLKFKRNDKELIELLSSDRNVDPELVKELSR